MDVTFPTEFNANPPADEKTITEIQRYLPIRLPDEYVEFLRKTNGGEGLIGAHHVILWRVEELAERNQEYQVAEFAPEIFLFGSNGGSEAFAFDGRFNPMRIIMIPFIFELEYAIVLGSNFAEFLKHLQNVDNLFDKSSSH